jgi:hypothetical protein
MITDRDGRVTELSAAGRSSGVVINMHLGVSTIYLYLVYVYTTCSERRLIGH